MTAALNPCTRCNGSGTEPAEPGMTEIRAYLTATGWKPGPHPGTAGELWHRDGWPHGIGVAFEGKPGSLECRSVITRLSWAEGRGEPEICADIMTGRPPEPAATAPVEPGMPPHHHSTDWDADTCPICFPSGDTTRTVTPED